MSTDVEYKPLKLFDFIKGMTSQKRDLDFNDPLVSKEYKQFIINKTISSSELYVPAMNDTLNHKRSANIPNRLHYDYLKSVLPKRYVPFTVPKAAGAAENDWMKPYLSDFFQVGTRDVEILMKSLTEDEIEEILSDYKLGVDGKMVEL